MTRRGSRASAGARPRSHRVVVALVTVVLWSTGASGCSGEDRSGATSGPVVPETSAAAASSDPVDCAAVIPDAAWQPLGWPLPAPATPHAGRCERTSPGLGQVTVATVAGGEEGGDEDAEAARRAYDDGCARLREHGSYVAEPAEREAPGQTACSAMTDRKVTTGVSEVVVLTPDDRVLHLRVVVAEPTSQARVRWCLRRLVEASL